MTHSVNLLDRARIERVVWGLDQRLYDLPRGSRIGKRRELRQNLLEAAHDVGTTTALRQLGSTRQLAGEYLVSEFGTGPRPSWMAAGVFLAIGTLFFFSLLTDAALAFGDGIIAAQPNATGTFHWSGISYLQSPVTYTATSGNITSVGGAATPLAWALWILGAILIGRLWLLPATWRRRRATARAGL